MTDTLNKHNNELPIPIPIIELHSDVKLITKERQNLIFSPKSIDPRANIPQSSLISTPNHKSHFYLKNPNENDNVTFKVQTTQLNLYRVNKTDGVIKPNEKILIRVTRLNSEEIRHSDKHALRILWALGKTTGKLKLKWGEKRKDSKRCLSLVLPCRFFVENIIENNNDVSKRHSLDNHEVYKKPEAQKLEEKGIVLYPQNKDFLKFRKSLQPPKTIQPVKKYSSDNNSEPENNHEMFVLRSKKILHKLESDLDRKRNEELNDVIKNLKQTISEEQKRSQLQAKLERKKTTDGPSHHKRFLLQFYLIFGMVAFFMGWMSGRFHVLATGNK